MKGSLPQKEILENFYKYDGRLTVVSFDSNNGKRLLTYGNMNLFTAIKEVATKVARYKGNGEVTFRIFIDLPVAARIPDSLIEAEAEFADFMWKPEWNVFR